MQRWKTSGMLFSLLLAAAGCSSDSPVDPGGQGVTGTPNAAFPLFVPEEGEFLGRIFENGVETTADTFWFQLEPFDQATIARLAVTNFGQGILWYDPDTNRVPIEFNAPSAGAQCGNSLDAYLDGDESILGTEFHRSGPGGGSPSGKEEHCIVPGRYRITLWGGSIEGTVIKRFETDYVQLEIQPNGAPLPVNNQETGTIIGVEAAAFNRQNNTWYDQWVVFDLERADPFSDGPILDIQNSGGNPKSSSFANQASPFGSNTDFFRFGAERSTSAWTAVGGEARGRALSRVFWNGPDPAFASGFYDTHDNTFIRIHQYLDVTTPGTVQAGLEIMRPDEEEPASQPTLTRPIQITSVVPDPPVATFQAEALSTWKRTDQILDATGSSSGPNILYSWRFEANAPFGPESADVAIEFAGHLTFGNKEVRLKVRDTGTGLSTESGQTFAVANSIVSVGGPSEVYDKTLQTYSSSQVGNWYERNFEDNGPTWFLSGWNTNTLNRIWAAGDYTVQIRSTKFASGELRRGRTSTHVCHLSLPQCIIFSVRPNFSVIGGTGEDFGIFGAGPWISAGSSSDKQLSRFYDLTGLHDARSPFASPDWLDMPKGNAKSEDGRWDVQWTALSVSDPDAKVVRLQVTPQNSGSEYVFGMAVDPDLGGSPVDDRSGYDPGLGMIHVSDGGSALGIMLLRGASNAISRTRQYGATPQAPRAVEDAWNAHRGAGISLDSRSGDVQLLISAEPAQGATDWRFVIIRASSVGELSRKADGVLRELGVPR